MSLSDAALDRLKAVAAWPEFTTPRYLVREEIGRGGMGTVYAAHDVELDRDVAIKIGNALPGAGLQVRLTREAQVIARLEHPGIVPVHDHGVLADGRPFYVMKRVQGRTLQTHLDSNPPLSDRLRIFERVCEAVSFAHAHGIIHRDLKPSNVMVGDFGEVMVMDWGVAIVRDRRTRTGAHGDAGTILGTRGFMPPEQLAGAQDVDQRADVYALGAMLFTLLTGLPPQSPEEIARRLAVAKTVPAPLRSICRCAIAEAPGSRYSSVAAMQDDIARFRARQAVKAHRERFLERSARFARAYQVPIILILAYVVMRTLIAIVAGW